MALSTETLKAMMRDYHALQLSDEELERIRPELDDYLAAIEPLRELDLSNVLSARLLRANEGGPS
jgi:Asp-tRNA(Asn)/Glu-tRNA(Gln) amidotransferase C subunit